MAVAFWWRCVSFPRLYFMKMKKNLFIASISLTSALLLAGCGQSSSTAPAEGTKAEPSSIAKAMEDAKPALTQAATQTVQAASAAALDLGQKLLATAQNSSDNLLKDLSKEVQASVVQLGEKLAGDATLKGQLDSALQAVLQGQDVPALEYYQKLVQAKLTPEQTTLVKQTGDILSAFMVQKNFGALEGAQTEVGQIVSALRKGDTATAIPYLQKVATNAQLTAPQKELLSSLADKYAPGVKNAAKTLQEGMKSLKF
jgi:hypothetical protein